MSDGPYRFSGLPGLIVKIEDNTDAWRLELLSLVKSPEKVVVNVNKAIKYKTIAKPEFYKQKKYLLDNLAHLRLGEAASSAADPASQAIIKEVAEARKTDNNWIELYP